MTNIAYLVKSGGDLPNGPFHVKMCLLAYMDSEGPDQTAHSLDTISGFKAEQVPG